MDVAALTCAWGSGLKKTALMDSMVVVVEGTCTRRMGCRLVAGNVRRSYYPNLLSVFWRMWVPTFQEGGNLVVVVVVVDCLSGSWAGWSRIYAGLHRVTLGFGFLAGGHPLYGNARHMRGALWEDGTLREEWSSGRGYGEERIITSSLSPSSTWVEVNAMNIPTVP